MQVAKRLILPLALLLCATVWGADEREFMVKLTVPDTTWTITIDEVHKVKNELWIIATVSRNPDMMGVQVISTVQASLKLAVPDLPVKCFIVGKTWNWKNQEPYTFIKNLNQIEKELKSGKLIYKGAKPNPQPKE